MINNSVRVLVVDDVASMRNILCLMLNRLGFETVEAVENAEQAIQKLEQEEFGLVISDWQMEGMTGLDLLNKIRETPRCSISRRSWSLPNRASSIRRPQRARAHRDISSNRSGSTF